MIDVQSMTTEDLENLRDELTVDLASIGSQLDAARSEAAGKRVYSDVDWYNRARRAKRMKGAQHQLVLRELGRRRKERQSDLRAAFEQKFIRVARNRLDPDLFQSILSEAESA